MTSWAGAVSMSSGAVMAMTLVAPPANHCPIRDRESRLGRTQEAKRSTAARADEDEDRRRFAAAKRGWGSGRGHDQTAHSPSPRMTSNGPDRAQSTKKLMFWRLNSTGIAR